ncbi:hypothetical protein T4E_5740 [Trichinella pseudospiralis]|uniref:Uncharacterized protein n=1 Tax=Trichinella pseudospiralis TaxID=6337 RepID=A0A0V0XKH1_TRIPS|nr:hypothetical protein T4E_5740 [Trichinella pseudospiralis]
MPNGNKHLKAVFIFQNCSSASPTWPKCMTLKISAWKSYSNVDGKRLVPHRGQLCIRKLQERLDQYNGRLALIERLIVKVSPEVEVQVQPPSTRSNDSPSPNAERLTISTENVSSVQAAGSKPSGHSQTPGPRLRRHNTCWQTEMAFGISPSSSQRGSPERQLPPRRGNSLIINVRSANDAGNNDQTQRSTTARV